VETPEYLHEKNLKIDYGFYISNQIAKPVSQIFGLCLENLRKHGYKLEKNYFEKLSLKLTRESGKDSSAIREIIQGKKNNEAERILFSDVINTETQKLTGQPKISSFFQKIN